MLSLKSLPMSAKIAIMSGAAAITIILLMFWAVLVLALLQLLTAS